MHCLDIGEPSLYWTCVNALRSVNTVCVSPWCFIQRLRIVVSDMSRSYVLVSDGYVCQECKAVVLKDLFRTFKHPRCVARR